MGSHSPEFESVQNSFVPFETTSSTFSEVESVATLSSASQNSSGADVPTESLKSIPVHPEFAFADGNIEIRTSDQAFWVHEYRLNKFSVFTALIQAAKRLEPPLEPGRLIVLPCEQKAKGTDIYNALKVLYASHIDGVPNFDSNTMISILRIATVFDYPALRKFAISKLEGMDLPAIQRIQLSDELSLPTWEAPAFAGLCSRTEPISSKEAEVLGMARFVEIARIREMGRTRWATELLKGINENLQVPDSGEPGKDKPDYSSGRSALPKCNCNVKNPSKDSKLPSSVIPCDIHKVAPQVLQEGQTLLKERQELLKQLGNVRSTVSSYMEQERSPAKLDTLDLETELSRATWIRRENIL